MKLRPFYPILGGIAMVIVAGCDDDDVVESLFDNTTFSEEEIEVNVPLDSGSTVSFKGGKTLPLDVGVGSGAFHFSEDSADEFFTITDRGPTIACADSETVLGVKDFCVTSTGTDNEGTIFANPSYTPTIYKFNIDTGGIAGTKVGYEVIQTIPLLDLNDQPISGLPTPLALPATIANGYDNNGGQQTFDRQGIDPEALVRLSNKDFWVAEEYAPSLIRVNPKGRILGRFVPNGLQNNFIGTSYQTTGNLPAILDKRQLDRGIESLAVSPDVPQFLYFMMESPLANPDSAAFQNSRYVRLFKISLLDSGELGNIEGEYVYELDLPSTFTGDNTTQQSDVKVSEMVALGTDKLVILERVTRHTKLYRVSIAADTTNILGSEWDIDTTSPSLEQLSDLAAQGITPLSKTKVFDSNSEKSDLVSNIEGLAVLNNEYVALINDNDFGIQGENGINGAKTTVTVLKIAEQLK